jgi:hypothetical protein
LVLGLNCVGAVAEIAVVLWLNWVGAVAEIALVLALLDGLRAFAVVLLAQALSRFTHPTIRRC